MVSTLVAGPNLKEWSALTSIGVVFGGSVIGILIGLAFPEAAIASPASIQGGSISEHSHSEASHHHEPGYNSIDDAHS